MRTNLSHHTRTRSQFSVLETKNLSNILGVISQGSSEGTITFYKLFRGTWTGVMLTPLSVAGDYVKGVLDFKWGKDYLNLLLSIPPGFVAEFFGYVRPLSNLQGPAYEVSFGPGGVHLIVVKFKNFLPYKIYEIKNARIYTDKLNDVGVIKNNSLLDGPSFQLRNNDSANVKK